LSRGNRTTLQNDGCHHPGRSADRHVGCARVLQACSASGNLSPAANRRSETGGSGLDPEHSGAPVRAVSGHDVSVTLTRPSAELPTRDRRRHGYRSPRPSPKSSCSRVRSVPDLRNRQCWVVHRYYDRPPGSFLMWIQLLRSLASHNVICDDDPIVGWTHWAIGVGIQSPTWQR